MFSCLLDATLPWPSGGAENQVKSVCCGRLRTVEQRSDVTCSACDFFLFCTLSHRMKLKDVELCLHLLLLLPLVFGLVSSVFLKCDCGPLIRGLLVQSFLQMLPGRYSFPSFSIQKTARCACPPWREVARQWHGLCLLSAVQCGCSHAACGLVPSRVDGYY